MHVLIDTLYSIYVIKFTETISYNIYGSVVAIWIISDDTLLRFVYI